MGDVSNAMKEGRGGMVKQTPSPNNKELEHEAHPTKTFYLDQMQRYCITSKQNVEVRRVSRVTEVAYTVHVLLSDDCHKSVAASLISLFICKA